MGRAGIRRRKPYTRLPRARHVDENDLVPPHIVWPANGAGFEASPYSTAGTHQRSWWVLKGLARHRSRRLRAAVVVTAWAVVLYIVGTLAWATLHAVVS
jgi:hypothetical protein